MKKKILSLLTVFAMILAFSMTAYAESAQDAADQVRFWSADNVVTEVFKKVKNWK